MAVVLRNTTTCPCLPLTSSSALWLRRWALSVASASESASPRYNSRCPCAPHPRLLCLCSREVTDHQRLAGAGYCFSASAPPFLCATAKSALQRMTVCSPVLDLQLTLPSLTRLCCMPAEALDDAAEARAAAVRRGSAHSPLQGPLLCGIPDAPRAPGRARRCLPSRAGCHLGQHRTRGTPPIVTVLCDSRPVCLHFGIAPPDCSAWSAACWCRVLCTCRTRQPGPRPRCASTSLRLCRSLMLRTPSACCRKPPTL